MMLHYDQACSAEEGNLQKLTQKLIVDFKAKNKQDFSVEMGRIPLSLDFVPDSGVFHGEE